MPLIQGPCFEEQERLRLHAAHFLEESTVLDHYSSLPRFDFVLLALLKISVIFLSNVDS